jgi:hypothetical protein
MLRWFSAKVACMAMDSVTAELCYPFRQHVTPVFFPMAKSHLEQKYAIVFRRVRLIRQT